MAVVNTEFIVTQVQAVGSPLPVLQVGQQQASSAWGASLWHFGGWCSENATIKLAFTDFTELCWIYQWCYSRGWMDQDMHTFCTDLETPFQQEKGQKN